MFSLSVVVGWSVFGGVQQRPLSKVTVSLYCPIFFPLCKCFYNLQRATVLSSQLTSPCHMNSLPSAPSGTPGLPNNGNLSTNTSSSPPPLGEPSKARREALKRKNEIPPIDLSNLCPIAKYYAAADRVFDQFKAHLEAKEYDDAYIIGRRFALFSTVSLPKHDYYKSPSAVLVRLRIKNQKDAEWVTRGLERIVQFMDKQELEKRHQEEERIRQQKEDEQKQQMAWEKKIRDRLVAVDSSRLGELDSKDSALDMNSKLAKLNALFPKDGMHEEIESDHDEVDATHHNIQPLPPPIAPPPLNEMNDQDIALFQSTSAIQQLKSNGATPMFADPPSYSDLFLDTLRISPPTDVSDASLSSSVSIPHKPPSAPRTSIRILRSQYSNQLESLQSSKRVEVIRLGTYQGRLSGSPRYDSTNGCTVISPLVVATHIYPQHQNMNLLTPHKSTHSKLGITNTAINEIIDKRSPPILQTVRSKLGLNQHALIVPSDVHDYLVDENILPQDKFVGVCGGNILNEDHWKEFVDMLANGRAGKDPRKQKVGAGEYSKCAIVVVSASME